ncbi:NAD(P)-dependent oxidoreductase [Brevibacillus porteri]|uniref:NAD(P)-dependent oxidoreductase n=1 Tax=Brevibacillus porteri TaxID=2126350 RepID=A0ABX5FGX1_9BACL|nr:NAD(P)-dependent oxidoreductase [Brevibacillus porteri]MED1801139.1 NAD(P)-dependent oxidoreductase [Brevibacillus porteri]MED2131746.1 NAD(P)-dependent oxidoreductase [Brevibacillus porteri]MED2743480.1 NAD(P)-dependent oxidoreductase [Brevibacillus porteri]MED2817606.1 NAD(P)-dependent oxidoreductase [Brevibacillus porteri]MED2897336.1 NAD(P)-dependent oxidoreductase [Brevibacillus porteri]
MIIGWIGLGNMGIPMASNLLAAGYDVCVWNRTPGKAAPLVALGAKETATLSDLVAQCDVLFTMVSDDDAVKAIYTGTDGLLSLSIQGKLAVDMSTISPGTSRYIAEQAQEVGLRFLDAPVSGSVGPAKEGKLVIMVGGEQADFKVAKPMLDKLGKAAFYLGPNGAGTSAKLAINLLLGITVQGVSETLLFARSLGIGTEQMLDIISESAVGTPLIRGKAASILADNYPAAFALKHMAKDLRLANEAGVSTPLAESVNATYRHALEEGLGELDLMAILRHLEGK